MKKALAVFLFVAFVVALGLGTTGCTDAKKTPTPTPSPTKTAT